jgi:regulation of enolase protein 1 (concanavalin A-like superfamily)
VVVPGNLNKSMIFHRVSLAGDNQMPPIAKNVVDANAVAVISQWIMSLPIRPASLPAGWTNRDVGDVGMSGEASYLNGRFNLIASGGDIWGYADAFHFVYRPLNGDGQIIARVAAMQYTDPWAKAGVMIRETMATDAKEVLMALSGQGGSTMQWRSVSGDRTAGSVDGPPAKLPYWVKLTRAANVFTGFVSADGSNWRLVGIATVPMNRNLFVGLAITSHNNAVLNSTLFDGVHFNAGKPGRSLIGFLSPDAWSGKPINE